MDRPLSADPDLRAERSLALDHVARDVLGEHLDEQRLALDDELDRVLEELGKARHVHALLIGGEVDRAVDHRGHDGLGVSTTDANGFLHSRDARARERERDLGRRRLEVVIELHAVRHAATVASAVVSARAATAADP